MSLNTGDIFEGTYQLEEKVSVGGNGTFTRWRADDITSYRRSEVVIDIRPGPGITNWHGKPNSPGVRMAGYSSEFPGQYVVWDKEQAPRVLPSFGLPALNPPTRVRVEELIEAISVASHETLSLEPLPEYWHYGSDVVLIFYHKVPAALSSFPSQQVVKEHWKQALSRAQPSEPLTIEAHVPRTPRYWPVVLSLVGILLAVGVYALRTQPQPDAEQTRAASRLIAFNQALERGMVYEKKAAYPEAVQSFETALREAPISEEIDARLDSLARAYTAYAQAECVRYRTAASPHLYFIPDQYYHYAAILTRSHTIETCK